MADIVISSSQKMLELQQFLNQEFQRSGQAKDNSQIGRFTVFLSSHKRPSTSLTVQFRHITSSKAVELFSELTSGHFDLDQKFYAFLTDLEEDASTFGQIASFDVSFDGLEWSIGQLRAHDNTDELGDFNAD